MILSKTPYRISFFGGGTDYPTWYQEHGGRVLATTINRYVRLSCRHLPPFFEYKHKLVWSKIEMVRDLDSIEHPVLRAVLKDLNWETGLEVHYDGDLPARAGMGSSSAFTVGLIHSLTALRERQVSKEQLAREALRIEQDVLREHVGSQDQLCAAYGGFNLIEFERDGSYHLSPVVVPRKRLQELESSLILVFTGFSRNAPEVAKKLVANLGKRTDELTRMAALVDDALAILRDDGIPIEEFGRLLDRSWQIKRTLTDSISNPTIDGIYKTALDAGALGGKLLGAGSGGFLLFYAPRGKRLSVAHALRNLIQVPFQFERHGSHIVVYQPEQLAVAA